MKRLWSPWRSHYIETHRSASYEECFLCAAGRCSSASAETLVVAAFTDWVVLLNRYPYNAGHVLVAPREHTANLQDLPRDASLSFAPVLHHTVDVVSSVLRPDGMNIGVNLGEAAGAGVPGHLHWHLVPRWHGDSNFMATVADTRVVSSALDDLWQRLAAAFANRSLEA